MSQTAAQGPAGSPEAAAAAPVTNPAEPTAQPAVPAAADPAAPAPAAQAAAPGEAAAGAEADAAKEAVENLRKARRIPVRFPACFHGRRVDGKGMVSNISQTGCLIEDAEPLVVAGGEVRLRFSLFDDSLPFELRGTVVRETPNGFAIRFTSLDPRTRQILSFAISRASQGQPEAPSTAAALLQPWRQKGTRQGS